MTKTDLTFPAFFKICRFPQFNSCFRCEFSFHEKRLSSQVLQWRDFIGPITVLCSPCIATNEIASFCIDNKLRQMAFFDVFSKVGKGRLSSHGERF